MTEGGSRNNGRSLLSTRLWKWAVTAAAAALFVGVAGCDTVAQIPFSDRSFQEVQPVYLMPQDFGTPSDSGQVQNFEELCGPLDGGESATMNMVFLDSDREPIKPDEDIGGQAVDPGSDDVTFDGGHLYSLPDLDCDDDDLAVDCGQFSCSSVGDESRCRESTSVNASGTVEFVGAEPDSQALAVVMPNIGRWEGRYHTDFEDLYEFDEDGDNRSLDGPRDDSVAVDSDGNRFTSLGDLASDWERLSEYVLNHERQVKFGFWLFGEDNAQVTSMIAAAGPGDDVWTEDASRADDAVDAVPRADEGRAGIYNSVIRVIQDGFGADGADVDEAHLLLLVPGYDERRQNDVIDVVNTAHDHDVAISVIQVDSALDEPDHVRDDREYYRDQTPCTGADECANYEDCREPIRYVDSPSTNDPDDVVWPEDGEVGQTFCLPDYDANGRVGPIEEYQRLACATGGSYTYVPDADRGLMHDPLRGWLWNAEAAWAVDVDIGELGNRTEPESAYLLETVLDVNLHGNERYRFDLEGSDSRTQFFTP